MDTSSQSRFVLTLVVVAVLCTAAIGFVERRSVPLAAYSPVSPVDAAPRVQRAQLLLRRALTRFSQPRFWQNPWPWIAIGLVGFGLLAWGLIRLFQRLEHK
jgi:hypothetical protein